MKSTILSILLVLGIFGVYKLGRYFYFKTTAIPGIEAPDLNIRLLEGASFKLSDAKGKYVLLHFWGSWCGPCRRESPQIRELYDQFHTKTFKDAAGFEIVSIAIESDMERWQQAVQNDGLVWPLQFSDFKMFDSNAAKMFGIRQIPTLILIGPDQKYIGKTWTSEELNTFLTQKLK